MNVSSAQLVSSLLVSSQPNPTHLKTGLPSFEGNRTGRSHCQQQHRPGGQAITMLTCVPGFKNSNKMEESHDFR